MILKLKILFGALLILFTTNTLFAQYIKYNIIDAQTKKPVPYATIKSAKFFVVADTTGSFMLPDSINEINISCVGYRTERLKVGEAIKTISLSQSIYNLNEVSITPLNFREFYSRFQEKNYENLEQNPFDVKFFYREFTKIKGKYVDFNEAFGLYHFEGMGNYGNVDANNLIHTIYAVRSLNTLLDRKLGLHQVNWLAAANNLSKYLILNFTGFYSAFDWKIDRVIDNDLVEVEFKPKSSGLSLLKSRQSRRGDVHAAALGAAGKVYIDNESLKLKKFTFVTKNFRNDVRSYRKEENGKFKMIQTSGELTFTENEFGKTVPLFLGCNISYFLKEKPNELIEKRLEFYFSDYDLENQETSDLEKKYKSKIVYGFPTRAEYFTDVNAVFSGAQAYDETFWKKDLPYPVFYDIEKVKNDLKSQGIDIYKKFKEFTNKYK